MLKLFRADRAGNKTFPEKYFSDGLLTKQLNSGDSPVPHEKYGWLKTIRSHIDYKDAQEKFIYDTTQYLSFTTDSEIAKKFLATTKNLKYHATIRNQAQAFLFTLTIDLSQMIEIGNGLYYYSYKCNYNKLNTDPKFNSHLSRYIGCNLCSLNKNYTHILLLINAPTFLTVYKDTFSDAYANAHRDKEWLLMPMDPMTSPHPVGFQSRIPIADFWTVDFYKYDL